MLLIVAVITLMLVVIKTVPGADKVVPTQVASFASQYASVAIGLLIVITGILLIGFLPVGIALIIIGAFMVYSNFRNKCEE